MSGHEEPQETRTGGATSVVLLVGLCTLAVASLASNPQDVAAVDAAQALSAVSEVSAGAPPPVAFLTDLRREEVVWHAGGRIVPAPDWHPRPTQDFVAVSHEPGGLPSGGLATFESPAWAARRFGEPNGWTWQSALRGAEISAGRPCTPHRFGRSRCGEGSWEWVGETDITVQKKSESCLWMHPLKGKALRVRFPQVPRGTLTGKYAFSDAAAQTPGGGPVEFTVKVGEREAVRRTVKSRKGWAPFRVSVSTRMDVSLEVSAARPGRRHFCVQLEHTP